MENEMQVPVKRSLKKGSPLHSNINSDPNTTRKMGFDELTPHLNKIATLYLKNNKRKVGWIYIDFQNNDTRSLEEICFISVQKGKKLITALENNDPKTLEPFREIIPLGEIERIRSSK
jgi:hypothetical protein